MSKSWPMALPATQQSLPMGKYHAPRKSNHQTKWGLPSGTDGTGSSANRGCGNAHRCAAWSSGLWQSINQLNRVLLQLKSTFWGFRKFSGDSWGFYQDFSTWFHGSFWESQPQPVDLPQVPCSPCSSSNPATAGGTPRKVAGTSGRCYHMTKKTCHIMPFCTYIYIYVV